MGRESFAINGPVFEPSTVLLEAAATTIPPIDYGTLLRRLHYIDGLFQLHTCVSISSRSG
jgi:hypothetical protein